MGNPNNNNQESFIYKDNDTKAVFTTEKSNYGAKILNLALITECKRFGVIC